MFSDLLSTISWQDTSARIHNATENDVRRALNKHTLSETDFMALISPAATPFLEDMAAKSRQLTRMRFGATMQLFIPIYLSNHCANSCVYCSFHRTNPMPRTRLTEAQIVAEYQAIKRLGGFESILLLTGEHPAAAGVDYIVRAVQLAKTYFADIQMEVMPLATEDYRQLAGEGLNGVVCFQETYHRENYNLFHPRGKKADFQWRLDAFDRMGMAGLHKISLGTLIGLDEDWRTDVTMMAYHLRYLQKTYWRTQYAVNFPRIRQAENDGFQPNATITDSQLAQLTFAMRIFSPEVSISYSTREEASFRDNMCTLGPTIMSAGSRTEPGGYSTCQSENLRQFHVSDERTPREICDALRARGIEPLWKDWSSAFNE